MGKQKVKDVVTGPNKWLIQTQSTPPPAPPPPVASRILSLSHTWPQSLRRRGARGLLTRMHRRQPLWRRAAGPRPSRGSSPSRSRGPGSTASHVTASARSHAWRPRGQGKDMAFSQQQRGPQGKHPPRGWHTTHHGPEKQHTHHALARAPALRGHVTKE